MRPADFPCSCIMLFFVYVLYRAAPVAQHALHQTALQRVHCQLLELLHAGHAGGEGGIAYQRRMNMPQQLVGQPAATPGQARGAETCEALCLTSVHSTDALTSCCGMREHAAWLRRGWERRASTTALTRARYARF